jgi:hypothetical protein
MEMIRYDQMDPANPPERVKLEECPNCKLPAVLVHEDGGWDTYVHTTWSDGRKRHYCKLSLDGCKVEVVIPVLPAEEKPCGST